MPYIVSRFPHIFPSKNNRKSGCGMYTLKAIIEWYTQSQINNYKYYADGLLGKLTGFMFPHSLLRVLSRAWITAKRIHCRFLSKDKKIARLHTLLQKWPVILLISHAYSSKTNFSFLRAFTLQHYITVWWYDDNKRLFYVYDSNTQKSHYTWDVLPVGNIVLDYDHLLWYWRLWWWGLYRDFGIAIDYTR